MENIRANVILLVENAGSSMTDSLANFRRANPEPLLCLDAARLANDCKRAARIIDRKHLSVFADQRRPFTTYSVEMKRAYS